MNENENQFTIKSLLRDVLLSIVISLILILLFGDKFTADIFFGYLLRVVIMIAIGRIVETYFSGNMAWFLKIIAVIVMAIVFILVGCNSKSKVYLSEVEYVYSQDTVRLKFYTFTAPSMVNAFTIRSSNWTTKIPVEWVVREGEFPLSWRITKLTLTDKDIRAVTDQFHYRPKPRPMEYMDMNLKDSLIVTPIPIKRR